MKNILSSIFPHRDDEGVASSGTLPITGAILDDEGGERFKPDLEVVGDRQTDGKIKEEVKREIQNAAVLSVKRLQVLQQGRCPQCGAALNQSMFVSVCDACGWSSFSVPRSGGVKVHTTSGQVIEGDRCHVVKDGVTLVIRGDAIFARIPAGSVEWVEYDWGEQELEERCRLINERLTISCGWCGKETSSE